MAVSVKRVTLWRGEVEDRPGALARVLAAQVAAGAKLRVVMGYRLPAAPRRAVLELFPVSGARAQAAARGSGLHAAASPTLLISGDDRPGLAHALALGLAEARINLSFLVAQVAGKRYSAVCGFENDADATRALAVLRKVAARRRSDLKRVRRTR
jgi:hypothetical protein